MIFRYLVAGSRSPLMMLGVFGLAFLSGESALTPSPQAQSVLDLRRDAWANPAVMARRLDDETGFRILVWQYQNDAVTDQTLYKRVNLSGFHIDRGAGQQNRVEFAKDQNWPYYVDHAAGKGLLHLTPSSGLREIANDGQPSPRPQSFFDPAIQTELRRRLDRNLPAVAGGPVMAIALDDEISLGSFNSPLEVDFSKAAVKAFRQWRASPNTQSTEPGNSSLVDVESPVTFDSVRQQIKARPTSQWRLEPWMRTRRFQDLSMAATLGALCRYAAPLAPGVPIGVVGGQQPSAYGGFDYSQLRDAVQWMEAYDIGGTNEILRSFWAARPRKPIMQTYFLSGQLPVDQWFLWYYLAHGNRSVIAWPSIQGQPWFNDGQVHPHVEALAPTFAAVQSEALGILSHPDTTPLFSPIAMLVSHPSVQVGWAIDATVHGKTWPRRSSSLDNQCLSSGKNRVAWSRLLEDLGHQPRLIDPDELLAGILDREGITTLILPQSFALDQTHCKAIESFVQRGGSVIADYGTAIVDEVGNGYPRRPLDRLFGLDPIMQRQPTSQTGWFDGQRRAEIDGEQYRQPLLERLPSEGCRMENGMPVVERRLATTWMTNTFGRGRTLMCNQSPTPYFDATWRSGQGGALWRNRIGQFLDQAGVREPVIVRAVDGRRFGVECLRYQTATGDQVWAIVANPTRQASVDSAGVGVRLADQPIDLEIQLPNSIQSITNLRTGEILQSDERTTQDDDPSTLSITLPPMEAIVLQVR